MSDLISKVLAGGLSAAIFLLWWPAHVPAEGPEWLVVRGLLWTLAFEILLISFCPLERAIATTVRSRRAGAVATRPFARALALAIAGLAIPVALIGGTDGELGAPVKAAAAAPPKVIVKREIVRRELVVRRVNHVIRVPVAQTPAATQAAATPATAGPVAATPKAAPRQAGANMRGVATTPERETATAPAAKAKAKTTPTAAKPTSPAAAAHPAPATVPPAATTPAPAATASSATATGPVPGN
jgi:hypothetical protein